jgi:uncharacterized protein (DUF433 family)
MTQNAPLTLGAEIVSSSSLHNGEPVVEGTATPVRAIAELWNQGLSPEEIPLRLPHLELRQVFAALYYYLSHQQEIDGWIAANRIPQKWAGRQFDPATRQVR